MRMDSKKAFLIFRDLLIIDNLKVLEVFKGHNVSSKNAYISLRSPKR